MSLPLQHAQSVMLQGGMSQTPRLKASTRKSPIFGAYEFDKPKRTISVHDQDYDLMGLSRHNAFEDNSHMNEMAQLDDLSIDFVKDEDI